MQTVPRAVWFDNKTKANIIQWPIEEIDELRSVELVVDNQLLQPGSVVEIETAEAAQVLNRCLGVFFGGGMVKTGV